MKIVQSRTWAGVIIALAAVATATAARAHAVLERGEAPADSFFKAVLGIPHGCDGKPTLRVRVRIPEGVLGVKPQPKPGWELAVRKEKLEAPVKDSHGATITEAVAEVTWSGSLADAHYDEFAMQMRLPDRPGETLYFATVQECDGAAHRWIEIPRPGQSRGELKAPAPALRLLPKAQPH
jgi:uncharacterized protein YcnI